MRHYRDPVSAAFIYGLGAAVTVAWLVSVFADIFVKGYETPVALHGIMGTVVGAVFAADRLRRVHRRLGDAVAEDALERERALRAGE